MYTYVVFLAVLDPVVVERVGAVIAVADRLIVVRRPTTVVRHAQGTGLLARGICFLHVKTRQLLRFVNYKTRTTRLNNTFSRTICVHQKSCYKNMCVETTIATLRYLPRKHGVHNTFSNYKSVVFKLCVKVPKGVTELAKGAASKNRRPKCM